MSKTRSLTLFVWSVVHPLSMGLAVAVLSLTGIVGEDGLEVVATGLLVYAGASLAALVTVFGRRDSRASTSRLTRSQVREMVAAAIVNLVYVIAFWTAVFGVAPLAAVTAGPLRVPLEVLLGKLWLRGQDCGASPRAPLAMLRDFALAASVVALSLWHSAGGSMADLLLQGLILGLLVASNAATEVLRLRISQSRGDGETVDAAVVILVNSVVATMAFVLWGLAGDGVAGFMGNLRVDRPWLFGAALIVGITGVFVSQYAKSQAVAKGLKAEKAARFGLTFAAASIVATIMIQALTLYALPGWLTVPWADQTPIWLDEARQLESLISLAVAWLVIADIVRRR